MNSALNFKNIFYYVYLTVFLLTQCAMLIAFCTFDIKDYYDAAAITKFCSILICFAASAIQFYYYPRDGACVLTAMLFTATADFFIIIIEWNEVGVLFFIATQITYFIRICLIKNKLPLISIIVRLIAYIAGAIILYTQNSFNFLTAITTFYFINLVGNAIQSATLIKVSKKYILFFVGLVLFIACDVCVGLMNLDWALNLNLPKNVIEGATFLAWVFYLPSQVLLVLSTENIKFKPFLKEKTYEK